MSEDRFPPRPILNDDLTALRNRTGMWPKNSAEAMAVVERLDAAECLLRWYVDGNLVEAGDEFGAWDDAVTNWAELYA